MCVPLVRSHHPGDSQATTRFLPITISKLRFKIYDLLWTRRFLPRHTTYCLLDFCRIGGMTKPNTFRILDICGINKMTERFSLMMSLGGAILVSLYTRPDMISFILWESLYSCFHQTWCHDFVRTLQYSYS